MQNASTGVERLMVTYLVRPHVVFELLPGGASVQRWTTHDPALFAPFTVGPGPDSTR